MGSQSVAKRAARELFGTCSHQREELTSNSIRRGGHEPSTMTFWGKVDPRGKRDRLRQERCMAWQLALPMALETIHTSRMSSDRVGPAKKRN